MSCCRPAPCWRRSTSRSLAALGITDVEVRRRLKVAIFSTGDEVVEPGTPRGGAAIYDANRYLLAELLGRLGAEVTDLGILRDEPERAFARACKPPLPATTWC